MYASLQSIYPSIYVCVWGGGVPVMGSGKRGSDRSLSNLALAPPAVVVVALGPVAYERRKGGGVGEERWGYCQHTVSGN